MRVKKSLEDAAGAGGKFAKTRRLVGANGQGGGAPEGWSRSPVQAIRSNEMQAKKEKEGMPHVFFHECWRNSAHWKSTRAC